MIHIIILRIDVVKIIVRVWIAADRDMWKKGEAFIQQWTENGWTWRWWWHENTI